MPFMRLGGPWCTPLLQPAQAVDGLFVGATISDSNVRRALPLVPSHLRHMRKALPSIGSAEAKQGAKGERVRSGGEAWINRCPKDCCVT